jgi:CRISPR/Cas system Type II protein with McrA/HNH and RuvC-like nuclease domain
MTSTGYALAEFTIVNRSSNASDFVTTIRFTVQGKDSISGPGFERGIPAGRTVTDQVVSTHGIPTNVNVRCSVATVRRSPSTVITHSG